MTIALSSEALDRIQGQVTDSLQAFKDQNQEADRLAALKAAQELTNSLRKPQDAPTQAMCVRIAVDLEIFTTLTERNGPVSLEELAAVKKASPILAVLRILAGIGYVEEAGTRVYTPTIMTRTMTDRLSISVIKFIFDVGMPTLAKVPEFLRISNFENPEGGTVGAMPYAEGFDETIWTWLPRHPEKLDGCNTFMEADRGSRPSWLEWFPTAERLLMGAQVQSNEDVLMVDVAGGRGHDLAAFAQRFPDATGRLVLEDLPHVLEESTVDNSRIEKIPFDLFKPQPIQGARVYYMKFILHDWSDEENHTILTQLAGAMTKGYSKLVIEFVLTDRDCAMLQAMWDWEMMIFCNSMERSQTQWTRLLEKAGFQVTKFWAPPGDGQGIIEAGLKE
ncbi:hypothetical protein N7512_001364 [Penicillium capsulatum]|nr:hypothetical protein N7512_001364 [Penicillium capsulatum]